MSAFDNFAKGHGRMPCSWFPNGAIALCVALFGVTAAFADAPVDWTKYAHSFTVKFSGYDGSTTLTDFPVLVRISESRLSFPFYAKCKVGKGGDLRFSDSAGNLLASEVDTWNPDGESLVWVKVPSLNADTVITGHFGCSSPDAVTPSDVWSNGFLGVWHLGAEGSSDQPDSVAGGNSFLLNTTYADGVRAGTNGVAESDYGRRLMREKTDGYGAYRISDTAKKYCGFSKFTVEYWTYQDHHDVGKTIGDKDLRVLYKANAWSAYEAKANGKMGFSIRLTSDTGTDKYVNPDNNAAKPPRAAWNHTVTMFDGTDAGSSGGDTTHNRAVYLNGNSLATTATADSPGEMIQNTSTLYLGNNSGADSYRGIIDEVRLSTVTRSADWVKASYDTIATESFAVYEGPQLDWTVYGKKFSLTFDGVAEGATLTDFPVLVRISEYDEATGKGIRNFRYADCLKADGGDLRFADESGTLLMSEVDTWNTNGESLVWVKVSTLTKGTKIWAYYGSKYAHAVNPKDVWSNGFLGVWHLGAEGSSDQPDSVEGGNAFKLATDYADGVSAGTNGVAGLAAAFNQRSDDGFGSYTIADSDKKYSGFTKFTVEYWTYQNDHAPSQAPTDARILYKHNAWEAYEAKDNGRNGLKIFISGGSSSGSYVNAANNAQNKPTQAVWNHSVHVFDGSDDGVAGEDTTINRAVYLNGRRCDLSSSSELKGTLVSNGNKLCLGNNNAPSSSNQYPSPYRGIIDEVRISTVTRSAAWVKATYDTIANNATFTTYDVARPNNVRGLTIIVR